MKPTTTQLNNLLATRQFFMADLYQFALVNGTFLRYCSGDADIVWNGFTWSSGGRGTGSGPFFDRKDNKAKCHQKIGVEVDQLIFDSLPGGAMVGGITLLSSVRTGGFDGAELTLYRAFMPTYGNVAAGGVVTMFAGRVAEIDASRNLCTFTINSHLELLNRSMPRNMYQAACNNSLFDHNCTLSQAAFTGTGTANGSSTASIITGSCTFVTNDYADQGLITFTSGVNIGISRSVKQYAISGGVATISLAAPFPNPPANSDTFSITAGCDKLQKTCLVKFNNINHLRAFPNIPVVETAV